MGAVKERSREGLSAYEIKRLEQIAKNEARLTALGIKGAVGRLVEDCDARKREQAQKRSEASRRAAESRRQRLIAGPTRGSERNKGKPKPTYRDDSYYSDFFTASRRAGGGGKRRSAPRDPLAARGGCPDQWPPDQVVLAAVKEAEDIVKSAKAKGGPAWLKVMSPSQVSGGFWMNMPSESRAAFSHLPEKCSIELECEGKRWPTVFLPRGKSGAGLSGGWRGFAIDLEIGTGDVCVFHLTSKRVLTTHIIRHKGERTYGSSGKQKQCDSKASTDTECAEGESHDEHVPEEDTRDGEPVRSWRNWLVSAISGKNTGKGTGEEKPAAGSDPVRAVRL